MSKRGEHAGSDEEAAVSAELSVEVERKLMEEVFVIPSYTFLLHRYENSITNNISERLKGPTQGWRGVWGAEETKRTQETSTANLHASVVKHL